MPSTASRTGWLRGALPVALAGAVALALAGCTGEGQGAPQILPTSPAQSASPGPGTSSSAPPAGSESQEALLSAGERALTEVPDSTVTAIDSERNGTVWEVHVVTSDGTEYEMDISADGSELVSGPTADADDAEDKAEHLNQVNAAAIDYREAAKRMLAAVPGGRITELELDSEHGKTVWEADVIDKSGAKHSIQIDAGDGSVLRDSTP
ncbi:PepSY domain-containing protein [Glaciibacter superstes]|uniref:PepSY domain-containing protein n=1 Tax=Glaciibacter superstes TaxID=501023 RepID=UPI0003B57B85|nr:PepSY domain-containing protein [Glaciibacter superstes]